MADNPNPEAATLPETDAAPISALLASELPGFVVIWGPADRALMGAWLPISSDPHLMGRGPALGSDPLPRVQPIRQVPGANTLLGPFASPALSRVQLELALVDDKRISVKNRGRCKLFVNEVPTEEAEVVPGDVVQIGNQLLLLCSQRAARLPGHAGQLQAFGEPDEHGFVGESPAMWQLRRELLFVGGRPGHVLVHGESGTGKELAANAVHRASSRQGPLVSRNAATFPETLIDAELFGSAKGFPNPGMPERPGLIGAADGGTLFLDEFAELPLTQQTSLLRVLDAGEYQRLGEATLRHADVRVVAATNRELSDLRADVAARFAFIVRTPSLRSRVEDIPLIVMHLLRQVARGDAELRARFFGADGEPNVSAQLITQLVRGDAVGNVRYLKNALWRSLAESRGGTLGWPGGPVSSGADARRGSQPPGADDEAARLREVLDRNGGSVDKTFRELGLSSRFALNRLLKKHGISVKRTAS